MKKIKIKYIGFWKDFDLENDFIYQVLKTKYDVEIAENADYIITSVFGEKYQYCDYPQIRIMYVGENYIPDFNYIDYAVSRYPLVLGDRNFCLPGCIDEYGHCKELQYKDRNYEKEILSGKEYFANFIASHESEKGIRGDFFKKLCEYKRVESAGTYLNNMTNGETVWWKDDSKRIFQKKCKFTLCFESTVHEGFITEKITDAFLADTIPVYYGSGIVKSIFNEKAFINCSDYECVEEVIEKIKELDENDEKYLAMLREPIFVDSMYVNKKMKELEAFVLNIFEQEYEKAYRRSRVYCPKEYEEYILQHQDKYLIKHRKIDKECRGVTVKELVKVIIKRGIRRVWGKK